MVVVTTQQTAGAFTKENPHARSIDRGYQYLRSQMEGDHLFQSALGRPKNRYCETNQEIFSSLLIANLISNHYRAETIRDLLLVGLKSHHQEGQFRFLKHPAEELPYDVNSTCLGLSFLIEFSQLDYSTVCKAIDRIVHNTTDQGVVRVYLSKDQLDEIVDPVVCLNVLYLANMFERADEVSGTQKYVQDILISRRYNQGSHFYRSPDSFLFFFTRLINHFPYLKLQWAYELKRAIIERIGTRCNTLELAMRVYMYKSFGLEVDADQRRLLAKQTENGGWDAEVLLENEKGYPLLSGDAITTAFALYALES